MIKVENNKTKETVNYQRSRFNKLLLSMDELCEVMDRLNQQKREKKK